MDSLTALEVHLEDNPTSIPRFYQILGDLQRVQGTFVEASASYQKAIDADGVTPLGALYGKIECLKSLKDLEQFKSVFNLMLEYTRIDTNILSRSCLAAAEIGDRESWQRAVERLLYGEPDPKAPHRIGPIAEGQPKDPEAILLREHNPRTWMRIAKSYILMDDRESAGRYSHTARAQVGEDKDLLVEISALDYDLNEYWELRYNSSQGERTPVPVRDQSDQGYVDRTKRDLAFLEENFNKLFAGMNFGKAADCGCGSGRLTPFLAKWCSNLECYDISPTAVKFAEKNNADMKQVTFHTLNMSENNLPAQSYNLVFDFTSVQHVSDRGLWTNVLVNYFHACKPGGYIYLVQVEGDGKRKDALHVSNATPSDYIKTFTDLGAELIFQETPPQWDEICLVFKKL